MFDKEKQMFMFNRGPIMTNLFLADEINRTSPKTQSALLEVMEEGIVTVDGHTMHVPEPFLVIATQNPVGSAGTQPLPDSQLDRFMICISLGYPAHETEIDMLKSHCSHKEKATISPIIDGKEIPLIQEEVSKVYIHDDIYDYILRLVHETRNNVNIRLGLSPRGSIALSKLAKSIAFLNGRDYCLPEDVAYIFKDVAIHRILPVATYRIAKLTLSDILTQILDKVEKPSPAI
ncbi:MAG: AAA family ATPase [Suipraeoptans sp.]